MVILFKFLLRFNLHKIINFVNCWCAANVCTSVVMFASCALS